MCVKSYKQSSIKRQTFIKKNYESFSFLFWEGRRKNCFTSGLFSSFCFYARNALCVSSLIRISAPVKIFFLWSNNSYKKFWNEITEFKESHTAAAISMDSQSGNESINFASSAILFSPKQLINAMLKTTVFFFVKTCSFIIRIETPESNRIDLVVLAVKM